MPSMNMPTAPASGVPSNLLTASGISDTAFVNIGGELRRSGYGRTIAGGLRLGRFAGMKSEGEIRGLMDTATKAQLNQYIQDRLAEGYVRKGESTLEKDMGAGVKQVITIDWTTGQYIPSLAPSDAALKAQKDYDVAVKKAQARSGEQAMMDVLGPVEYLKNKALLTDDPIRKQFFLEQAAKQAGKLLVITPTNTTPTNTANDTINRILATNLPFTNIGQLAKMDISKNISIQTITPPAPKRSSGGGGGSSSKSTIIGYTKGGSPITKTSPVLPGYTGAPKPTTPEPSYKQYTDVGSSLGKMFGLPKKDSKGKSYTIMPEKRLMTDSDPIRRFLNAELPKFRRWR